MQHQRTYHGRQQQQPARYSGAAFAPEQPPEVAGQRQHNAEVNVKDLGDGLEVAALPEQVVGGLRVQPVADGRGGAHQGRAHHKGAAYSRPLPAAERHGQREGQRHAQQRQLPVDLVPPHCPLRRVEAAQHEQQIQ